MWNPFAPRRLTSKVLGARGERRAAWFYRLRGYAIVARNVRFKDGEIDLVARRGRTLAIVEVKARQSLSGGEAFEAVDRRKRERLVRLADRYVTVSRPSAGTMLRYDILSLFWTGHRFVVQHFPDAFRPIADARRPWLWHV